MGRLSLDYLFLKRLWALLKILFPWNKRSITLWLAVIVLGCTIIGESFLFPSFIYFYPISDQITTYLVGVLSSEFYVVLGNKDISEFKQLAFKSFIIILGRSLVSYFPRFFYFLLFF